MRDDRKAMNIKVLARWFSKYRKTLPDRVAIKVVNAEAKKALKGKTLDQMVVRDIMRDAGYDEGGPSAFFERKKEKQTSTPIK